MQTGTLVLRALYFLVGAGCVYSGIAMFAGIGTITGRSGRRMKLGLVPAKTRIPYVLYHLLTGVFIALCAAFVPSAWPWMLPVLLPLFLFPVFVILPALRRYADAHGPHQSTDGAPG